MTDLWPSLVALISARRPGFLATAEGVERAELARWEARFNLTLPRIYVDLMQTMGRSSGDFNPLGAYEHRLEPLAEQWAWLAEEEPAPIHGTGTSSSASSPTRAPSRPSSCSST
ncbi:SMI1/KNR4 family protein [Nannocystis pusilla]|uniref:SMI1/KNR4 family protein n=1 Tax=Nannocystis pusilla TaxID=889268 RepID=UPI003B79A617